MASSTNSVMRTPTKRPYPEDDLETSSISMSPKFIKPSDVFRKRARRSLRLSPIKPHLGARLCPLPIETVVRKKNYSPLKCLQPFTISNSSSGSSSCKLATSSFEKDNGGKKPITFSPLMKKLQRSPARNAIQFPVVKRTGGLSSSTNSGTIKRQLNTNTFSRVLNFSEDANFFPEKFESFNVSPIKTGSFQPITYANIDWSLKTKLRLTTNRQIPFHGSFKPIDEATGLSHFVHGVNNSTGTSPKDNFAAQLHRHCLVWQHPSLPWIKLFPRTPDLKPGSLVSSTTPVFSISSNSKLADSLYSDFSSSLQSLFKLLKSKHCPYFYLCANNFTIIFRASGVAGSADANALITPTTHGFRKLLKEEGINFDMPLHQYSPPLTESSFSDSSCSSGFGASESSELPTEEEIIDEEDAHHVNPEENDKFLESLGLSQQDFPSLDSGSLRRRRIIKSKSNSSQSNGDIDDQTAEGRMKSLVRIDGIPNCQTLLGLFINMRKICVSSSGPFSGLPPTLLSPIAFHGATLTPLSVKQKMTEDSRSQNLVSLDVIGPILPHTMYGLMNIFGPLCSQSVGPNVTMLRSTMRTYEQSSSFPLEIGQRNKQKETEAGADSLLNPTFAVENLEESGLDKRFLMAICSAERQLAVPLADFELTPSGIRYNRTVTQSSKRS